MGTVADLIGVGISGTQASASGEGRQYVRAGTRTAGAYVNWVQAAQEAASSDAIAAALAEGASAEEAAAAGEAAAAKVTGADAASTIGDWLPYVGMGLSFYNIAAEGATPGNVTGAAMSGLALAGAGTGSTLGMGLPYAASVVSDYMDSQRVKHGHKYIEWQEPDLEVIGHDGDWVILYDNYVDDDVGGASGQYSVAGYPRLYRYNPNTNELQSSTASYGWVREGTNGQPDVTWNDEVRSPNQHAFLTKEEATQLFEEGQTGAIRWDINPEFARYNQAPESWEGEPQTQFIKRSVTSDEVINWQTVDMTQPIMTRGGDSHVVRALFYNPQTFQTELYNEVLLAEGYVEAPSEESGWRRVTMGGEEYWASPGGLLAGGDGALVGNINTETGDVTSFQTGDRTRIRSDGSVDPVSFDSVGQLDDWETTRGTFEAPVVPSTAANYLETGEMPERSTSLPSDVSTPSGASLADQILSMEMPGGASQTSGAGVGDVDNLIFGGGTRSVSDNTTTQTGTTTSTRVPTERSPELQLMWNLFFESWMGTDDTLSFQDRLQAIADETIPKLEEIRDRYQATMEIQAQGFGDLWTRSGEVYDTLGEQISNLKSRQTPISISFGGAPMGEFVPYTKTIGALTGEQRAAIDTGRGVATDFGSEMRSGLGAQAGLVGDIAGMQTIPATLPIDYFTRMLPDLETARGSQTTSTSASQTTMPEQEEEGSWVQDIEGLLGILDIGWNLWESLPDDTQNAIIDWADDLWPFGGDSSDDILPLPGDGGYWT